MDVHWRQEVPEDLRKQMIAECFQELRRVSGVTDTQRVWDSATKWELKLWSNSLDRNAYLMAMHRKLQSLKKKPSANEAQVVHQGTLALQKHLVQPQGAPVQAQMMVNSAFFRSFPQSDVQVNNVTNNFAVLNATNAASAFNVMSRPKSKRTVNAGMTDSQQQQQLQQLQQQQQEHWLQQILAQFQAQQQQLSHVHNQEMQQLLQQQLNEQHQLVQQLLNQQALVLEEQRQRLHQLQLQHESARGRLVQLQVAKHQQVQRKQQQQVQQDGNLADPGAISLLNPVKVQAPAPPPAVEPTVPEEPHIVKTDQDTASQAPTQSQIQAAAPTPSPTPVRAPGVPASAGATSYADRSNVMKLKYWDDLVAVYRELERMSMRVPTHQQRQQELINTYLGNLKRTIALLQQDPAQPTSSNTDDLDRIEAHIQNQVQPILERLKNKARAARAPGIPGGDATSPANSSTALEEGQEQQQQQLYCCCCCCCCCYECSAESTTHWSNLGGCQSSSDSEATCRPDCCK